MLDGPADLQVDVEQLGAQDAIGDQGHGDQRAQGVEHEPCGRSAQFRPVCRDPRSIHGQQVNDVPAHIAESEGQREYPGPGTRGSGRDDPGVNRSDEGIQEQHGHEEIEHRKHDFTGIEQQETALDGYIKHRREDQAAPLSPPAGERVGQTRAQGGCQERRIERDHRAIAKCMYRRHDRIQPGVLLHKGFGRDQHRHDCITGAQHESLNDQQQCELAGHGARGADAVQNDRQCPRQQDRSYGKNAFGIGMEHIAMLTRRPSQQSGPGPIEVSQAHPDPFAER